jgi:glycosyltransferase involved in cell wall biosynthesis
VADETSVGGGARSLGARPPSPADPLRGRDILCFSTDWNWQGMAMGHLARLLARDNRVLWVDSIGYRRPTASPSDAARVVRKLRAALGPIREVLPNLFVVSPLIVPAYDRPGLRAFNRRLLRVQVARALRRLGFGRPVNFVFLPTAGMVAGDFGEEVVIYYCVDEFAAFAGVSPRAIAEQEADLARRSDLVVVTSAPLLRAKSPLNPRTVLVRHGVDFDHFRRALDPATRVPDAIAALPRPVLGFFGLVGADWVDVGLLARVADRFPGGSLVVLGLVATDVSALGGRPNVHLLGPVPYAELPAYCKGFDVALIPFRLNAVTLHSNPLKAREYLAAGLPVVSTAIPEVEAVGGCRIAAGEGSFLDEVAAALEDPGASRSRSEAMRQQTWEARLDELRAHLSGLAPRGTPGPAPGPT